MNKIFLYIFLFASLSLYFIVVFSLRLNKDDISGKIKGITEIITGNNSKESSSDNDSTDIDEDITETGMFYLSGKKSSNPKIKLFKEFFEHTK